MELFGNNKGSISSFYDVIVRQWYDLHKSMQGDKENMREEVCKVKLTLQRFKNHFGKALILLK